MFRQLRLAARPRGLPQPSDFTLVEAEDPVPADGEVLVRVTHLSLDPAMRGWLNEGRSYIPPVELGAVMRAQGAGVVVRSTVSSVPEGSTVIGLVNAQELAVVKADGLTVVDPSGPGVEVFLGALGLPGLTAYFGLFDVGALKPGETVVVSAAAGAVGSIAVQLARLSGARVIGIAGGPDKCRMVREELGAEVAIDYRSEDVRKALRKAAPRGIDVYFDNVGGPILDAALSCLGRGARVVICGAISQYNATEGFRGPANYMSLLVNRARMEGFVVFDYAARYPEARERMGQWIASGALKAKAHVVEADLSLFVPTLNKLFSGENTGKLLLKLG